MDDRRWAGVVAAVLLLTTLPLFGQFYDRGWGRGRRAGYGVADDSVRAEFFFARLAYSGYSGWGRQRWTTDWPDAEFHFMQGLRRLSGVDAAEGGRFVRPMDEELFEYPWLYAVEVGGWSLTDEEAERLREYLLRGGFLVVDDFHGGYEWAGFVESMRRVFPDRPIIEMTEEDYSLHVVYDLDQRTQVPGVQYVYSGRTYEKDGFTPHWRGIYDDDNRLMVAINFNMDLGDAWEHADEPRYPEAMTALAYRFGVNYVVYAMTH